jgi:peptide/nickel transport system permease protein
VNVADATAWTRIGARVGRRAPTLGKLGYGALIVITLFGVIAIIGPAIAPHDPNALALSKAYYGPTSGHPLGYDSQGHDLLSRLLAGARTSLLGALAIVVVATVLGTGLALVAAWRGGWIDTSLSMVFDFTFAFPGLLLAVLAVAVFGAGLQAVVLALAISYTPYTARTIRSSVLTEVSRDYVAALRVQGSSGRAICLRHLLPNVMPMVVAQATISFSYAVVDLAAISFLGLGVQLPQSDWGLMVATGSNGILEGYPLESLSAGACLVVAVIAFNIVGERLLGQVEETA